MDEKLQRILPHRHPFVMIDRLVESYGNAATAVKIFAETDYAVTGGFVSATALIEGLAQTVAAAFGERAVAGGKKPGFGMLVGVSDFRFEGDVKAGSEVVFKTTLTRELPPFYLADGEVFCDGKIVAGGSMKFHIEEG